MPSSPLGFMERPSQLGDVIRCAHSRTLLRQSYSIQFLITPRGLPVDTSHKRTVLSTLVLASSLPSGLNATSSTQAVWPLRGSPCCLPLSTFHKRTVLSPLAVASSSPSGLNSTPLTPFA